MGDAYADAVVRLNDAVNRAAASVDFVLTDAEIAKELRRIADEIEAEGTDD